MTPWPVGLFGVLLLCVGLFVFLTVALLAVPVRLLNGPSYLLQEIVWWSGAPVVLGISLLLLDIVFLAKRRRHSHSVMDAPVSDACFTVVLTAYNDELSIGQAVKDFSSHPLVKRVVVVDNNSSDATSEVAHNAGALVVKELNQGYGHCVHRALTEAAKFDDTPLVALCEGDMTFRALDLDKLLAYIRHADVVNGTRIVEQLRSPVTQLTNFMFWGNFIGGKLLEIKHLGSGTLTDLGTTYKVCRRALLAEILDDLNPQVNLEFNAYFLDTMLRKNLKLVEAPVTFHARLGASKGGNVSNFRAVRVGVRMFLGIVVSWRLVMEAR